MKKTFAFLFQFLIGMFLTMGLVTAQIPTSVSLGDFENGSKGGWGTWGGSSVIVENPDNTGINASDSVLYYTPAGSWQGIGMWNNSGHPLGDSVVVQVYTDSSNVQLRLQLSSSLSDAAVYNSSYVSVPQGVWTELVFDISSITAMDYRNFAFQTHDNISPLYFDNISIEGIAPPAVKGIVQGVWNMAPVFPLAVVNNNKGTTDADDFSGDVRVLWDTDNLYVLLSVKDDSLNTTNGQPWQVDHYSLYFDLNNLKTTTYVKNMVETNNDSVQFMLESIWGKFPKTLKSNNGGIMQLDSAVHYVEVINKGTGYVFEARLPLKDSFNISLASGREIGFDAKIADNDGDSIVKEEGKLSWNQVKDDGWKNPSYLGTIKLEDNGTVSKVAHTPVIDGIADYRWYPAATFNLDVNNLNLPKKPAANFSGNVKLLWDAENIYVLLTVKDDSLNTTNGQPWQLDHYSLYFDMSNLKTAAYVKDKDMTNDSVQFMLESSWGKAHPNKTLVSNNGGIMKLDSAVHYVEVITKGTGYVFEARIPIKDTLGITLEENRLIGFDVKIADNDGDPVAKDDGKLSWFQKRDESYRNPSYMGTIKLEGNGAVSQVANAMPVITDTISLAWNSAYQMRLEVWNEGAAIANADGNINSADLRGTVRLLWDDEHIYTLLEVNDDSLNITNGQTWQVDHFSLYYDLLNLKTATYKEHNKDSAQFNYEKPWSKGTNMRLAASRNRHAHLDSAIHYTEIILKNKYILQLMIPVKDSLNFTPAVGKKIGFDAKIGDNDGDSIVKLDGKLSWFQGQDEGWRNPSWFGTVVFDPFGVVRADNPPSNNANLRTLKSSVIAGTWNNVFHPGRTSYNVELPLGTTEVTTNATVQNALASISVVPSAEGLPRNDTVIVTAANGFKKKYTVKYTVPGLNLENVSELSFQMYPVPVKDILTLENISPTAKIITITSLTGQVVATYQVEDSKMPLDLSKLNSGMYLISIADKNGNNSATRKLLVE